MKKIFNQLRKFIAFILAVMAIVTFMPATAFAASSKINVEYRDASKISGAQFTDRPGLAKKLDEVFAGNVELYTSSSMKKKVSCPLGKNAVAPGNNYYAAAIYADGYFVGQSCYIYGNALSYTLWGYTGRNGGSKGLKDKAVLLNGFSNYKLKKNGKLISGETLYKLFVSEGVIQCGAYLITSGTGSHTMIILSWDKNGVWILEGNGNGNGMIQVKNMDWDTFVTFLAKKDGGRYIQGVSQPTQKTIESLYPKEIFNKFKEGTYVDITKDVAVSDLEKSCKATNLKKGDCVAVTERLTRIENKKIVSYLKLSDNSGYVNEDATKKHVCKDANCSLCLANCEINCFKSAKYKVTKDKAAIHYGPAGASALSIILDHVEKGVIVQCNKTATNTSGNVFYALTNNNGQTLAWIYGEYVKEVK